MPQASYRVLILPDARAPSDQPLDHGSQGRLLRRFCLRNCLFPQLGFDLGRQMNQYLDEAVPRRTGEAGRWLTIVVNR